MKQYISKTATVLILTLSNQVCFAQTSEASNLPACKNSLSLNSKAFLKVLPHIYGFEEIRHFLSEYKEKGYNTCATGVALSKNQYHYSKFLVNISLKSTQHGNTNMLVLFQASSVQAHHNTGRKPWVILDANSAAENFKAISENFKANLKTPLQNSSELLKSLISLKPELKIDPTTASLLPLPKQSRQDRTAHYVLTWLKEVATGALYTKAYSPQMLVIKQNKNSNQLLIDSHQSAFDQLFLPLEKNILFTAKTKRLLTTDKGFNVNDFIHELLSAQP